MPQLLGLCIVQFLALGVWQFQVEDARHPSCQGPRVVRPFGHGAHPVLWCYQPAWREHLASGRQVGLDESLSRKGMFKMKYLQPC